MVRIRQQGATRISRNGESTRLIEAAGDLGPTIAGMRDKIEQERRLPPALVEQLRDLGFFSLWLPREFGGPALSLSDFVRVVEAVSRLDGSVGWCVTNAGMYSMFAGLLPEAVARAIFVDRRSVVAGTGGARGTAVPAPGGYRISGRWAYGSGIMHSDWVVGGCVVCEGDTPRRKPDGGVDTRIMFFPTAAAEIIDTWDVGGLRGSGSHDYQVTDLFVPASHTALDEPLVGGPLYAVAKNTALAITIAAVPLGIARAALEGLKELSAQRIPRTGSVLLRDKPVFQAAVGRAEALLRGARAFLFEVCDDSWDNASAGAAHTLEQRALARLACAQVSEATKAVVQIAYDAGGGTAVYQSCPLQRCFQDVHTAAQHVQVQSSSFETGGRVLLGLEPGTPIL